MTKRPRQRVKGVNTTGVLTGDTFLNRNAVYLFVVFSLFAFWAFWPSYFSRLADQPEVQTHLHGIGMSLWCGLLITQGYLIRTKNRSLHKAVGKASYFLVPFIAVSTLHLVHSRLQGMVEPAPLGLFQLALMVNAVPVFVALYILAMASRRLPAVHARYMICTVFPLFTPITDRLIYVRFPRIAMLVPVLDGSPLVPVAGFFLADVVLVGLLLWDWLRNKRLDVFPIALGLLLLYHASVLSLWRFEAWSSFARWFLRLPLS